MSVISTLLLWPLIPLHVFAQPAPEAARSPIYEVVPALVSERARNFLDSSALEAERTVQVHTTASDLVLTYSADQPFEFRVSFPQASPLDSLGATLEPLQDARVSIDLTRSPAWSPWRDRYLLQVFGASGGTVLLHDVSIRPPSLGRAVWAALGHFSLDEPVLLSSINFLWGYRVLGVRFTVLLGSFFLLAVLSAFARNPKSILVISLLFLLLYDARFSLDLMRTTIADLREWYGFDGLTTGGQHEYRQLGPVHQIAAFLRGEAARKVVVCYDGNDIYKKHLRYLLYPTPVLSAEASWRDASHAVFIDTDRWRPENGEISCGGQDARRGETLKEFSHESRVVRFSS